MILRATYDEINDLISRKIKYDVKIDYSKNNTLAVTYTAGFNIPLVGRRTKSFSADVKILSVDNTRITANIVTGNLAGLILDTTKSLVKSKAPSGFIEQFDGRRIVINLAALPNMRKVFSSLHINGLVVEYDGVKVDASVTAWA